MKVIKTYKSFVNEGVDRVRDLSELWIMEDWIKSFYSKIEKLSEDEISSIFRYIEITFGETVLEIIEHHYSADKLHYYQTGSTVSTGGDDTGYFIENFKEISSGIDKIVQEYITTSDDNPTGYCDNPTCRKAIYNGSSYCGDDCQNEDR